MAAAAAAVRHLAATGALPPIPSPLAGAPTLPPPRPLALPARLQARSMAELSQQAAEFLKAQRSRPRAAAAPGGNGAGGNGAALAPPPSWWAPNNPDSVRTDIADLLGESMEAPEG